MLTTLSLCFLYPCSLTHKQTLDRKTEEQLKSIILSTDRAVPFKGSAVYAYESQIPLITRHRHNASQDGKTSLDASFAVIKNRVKIDANHMKTNITTPGFATENNSTKQNKHTKKK